METKRVDFQEYQQLNEEYQLAEIAMSKILVVDDSRFQLNQLIRPLEAEGHEILSAENGKIGLDLFEKNNPDCVLTDLNMPEMDGLELLERIRSQDIKTPVIVITSDTQELTYKKCIELGATEVLHKPFKKENLLDVIETAFRLMK